MHMVCFQCQETSAGRGCTFGGHCGKSEETANFQDLLIYVLKGIGVVAERLHLGVRNIRLGPSLPAFLSPRIIDRLRRDFRSKTIGTSQEDVALMMAGR